MNDKEIAAEIRRIKQEMREQGIRRTSCFNGGLDPVTYRYNAKLFELETLKKRAQQQPK